MSDHTQATAVPVEMVQRDGGRRVAVHRLASGKAGRTLVLCHAAPGSGLFDPLPEQTRSRDVTLLAPDRPGYGLSDPLPAGEWASVGAAADDLAAALDQLGTGPVGVAGWSAGGRVALALAARRPDLVDRVVLLGTPAPNEQVAWVPREYQAALERMRDLAPDQVRAALVQQFSQAIPHDAPPEALLELLGASDADSTALALPGARDRLARMLQAALAQGVTGLAAEIAGYSLQPWGFAPAEVRAKTLLLYGSRDPQIGPKHGRWWQQQLPDARLEVAPGEGHLLIMPLWHRVLAHLAPQRR
ncbi:MAG TPA: alpha/beta fold hydrolase [Roseiflexaceae bacterium]|nr:alpha/beta fold hydrolase [Roseiflexaceae bacterium]